ncbi:Proteasome subunit beta type-3 [Intoshia linei]|uniref:Proteasome subunit beta n=1 Tax=Intoshia linei TaxID=1819745 RepID=A0A177B6B7_9BILA|nr:Proteasome subunit beta type-3 [Intoshia linei]
MSALEYNGSAMVAMCGDRCVAIASDKRLGINLATISMDFKKIYEFSPHVYVGFAGLATDVQTVSQRLKYRVNMYEYREDRYVPPDVTLTMLSNLLYERRFGPYFIEPVVAGLKPDTFEPYIGSTDLIGCKMSTNNFLVSGTCEDQLYGACESTFRENMNPEQLFETISQCILMASDRDAISGWGCEVYIMYLILEYI